MAQNEKILAGVLEIFRHNPQKQFRVDQIEREARRDRLGNFTELIKALSFLAVSYTHLTLPTNREV